MECKIDIEPAAVVGILKSGDKYSQPWLSNTWATSWQANTFMELVKVHCMMAPPSSELLADGSQKQTILSPPEVVSRSLAVMDLMLEELTRRKWIVPMPRLEELREEESSGVGFTRGNDRT